MLKTLLRSKLVLMSTAVFLIIFGLYGTQPSSRKYDQAGNYIVELYQYGILITQAKSQVFYNIHLSPNTCNVKEATPLEYAVSKHWLKDSLTNFLSYIGVYNVKATFKENDETRIVYETQIHQNLVTINLKGLSETCTKVRLRVSLNEGDILFDGNGYAYAHLTPEEVQELNSYLKEKEVHIKVHQEGTKTNNINYFDLRGVYILNKNLNGIIKINNTTANYIREIDIKNKFIEIELNNESGAVTLELLSFNSKK